jgi:hypothetical protein
MLLDTAISIILLTVTGNFEATTGTEIDRSFGLEIKLATTL